MIRMRFALAGAAALLCAIHVVPKAVSAPFPEVPPVSAAAAALGFVDVRTAVPDALIDLRYATANNFVGTAAVSAAGATAWSTSRWRPGLAKAADVLRAQGVRTGVLGLLPPARRAGADVRRGARPRPGWPGPGPYSRSHEAGRSVDVTLAGSQRPARHGNRLRRFHSSRRLHSPPRDSPQPNSRTGRCSGTRWRPAVFPYTPGSGGISTGRVPVSSARSSTLPSTEVSSPPSSASGRSGRMLQ